jgi:hypothetical protein
MRAFATKRIRSWKAFYKFALRLNSPAPFKERGWVFRGQTDDWPFDLLPDLPSFIRRVCSSFAPGWGVLRTQLV